MQRDELRLECLKIVYRRDRSTDDNIRDAGLLEGYLIKDSGVTTDKKGVTAKKRNISPKKAVGNSDLFN